LLQCPVKPWPIQVLISPWKPPRAIASNSVAKQTASIDAQDVAQGNKGLDPQIRHKAVRRKIVRPYGPIKATDQLEYNNNSPRLQRLECQTKATDQLEYNSNSLRLQRLVSRQLDISHRLHKVATPDNQANKHDKGTQPRLMPDLLAPTGRIKVRHVVPPIVLNGAHQRLSDRHHTIEQQHPMPDLDPIRRKFVEVDTFHLDGRQTIIDTTYAAFHVIIHATGPLVCSITIHHNNETTS
jgi:hypothetical protein